MRKANPVPGSQTGQPQKRHRWIWIPVSIVLVAAIAVVIVLMLGGFGESHEVPEDYKVEPTDALAYFTENALLVSTTQVKDAAHVHTEAEAYALLAERGFDVLEITSMWSMDGSLLDEETEIDPSGLTRHPLYQTGYLTESGDYWTIYEINGAIFALPVSYNIQSASEADVIYSESGTVISYDATTNAFYETVPNADVMIVKQISRIDAQALETLTTEEIGQP